MSVTRLKAKNRRDSRPFLRVPRHLVDSPEYANLSAIAVKLMIDLQAQYRGNNNGDLSIAWKLMKPRGWKSKDTLYRAIGELQDLGFAMVTRRGGRRIPTLYALTYLAIDECNGKLDVRSINTAPDTWEKKSFASREAGIPVYKPDDK